MLGAVARFSNVQSKVVGTRHHITISYLLALVVVADWPEQPAGQQLPQSSSPPPPLPPHLSVLQPGQEQNILEICIILPARIVTVSVADLDSRDRR